MRVSYLEIYNEELGDLLSDEYKSSGPGGEKKAADKKGAPELRGTAKVMESSCWGHWLWPPTELDPLTPTPLCPATTPKAAEERARKLMLCDSAKGVVCNNLTETVCGSAEEVFACLTKGVDARQVVEAPAGARG